LKVNIYCDGCEKRVKKILHKINGKNFFLIRHVFSALLDYCFHFYFLI
jgi:copper chaperone CopZ